MKTMEDAEKTFEVRDLRQKDQFITDDQFLNGYARFVGIYAVGVYNSLCRHANIDQNSWPSIKKMSDELGVGRNSVIEGIKRLEFWNLIAKKRIGKTANNRYWLIHKKEWEQISEVRLKDFSEIFRGDFSSLCDKLHQSMRKTSKKGATSNELIKKGESSFSKRGKPYFQGREMRRTRKDGKWWVIPEEGGRWLEFAGQEEEIEWRSLRSIHVPSQRFSQ